MKSLILKAVMPLTVISFATITKWWYALPIDAPDTLFTGFPLAYTCPGWHTSLSLQLFITEFIVDILSYFLFWLVLLLFIDHFLIKIRPYKWLTIGLWFLSVFITVFGIISATNKENLFYIKRPFDMQILETGYTFTWQKTKHPDYYEYFKKDKEKQKQP